MYPNATPGAQTIFASRKISQLNNKASLDNYTW